MQPDAQGARDVVNIFFLLMLGGVEINGVILVFVCFPWSPDWNQENGLFIGPLYGELC